MIAWDLFAATALYQKLFNAYDVGVTLFKSSGILQNLLEEIECS